MKLSEAIDEYVLWGTAKYASSTIVTYRSLLKRFLKHSGNIDLKETNATHIVNYHHLLRKQNYHDSSIAYMMITLRQFFKYLFIRRLTDWDYQLIPVNKYINNSFPPVEPDDARAMINRVRITNFRDLRDKTILSFLHASGVRAAELCALTAQEIRPEKGYAVIISKKNRLKRMIFWDEVTTQLLRQYLLERTQYAKDNRLWIATDRAHKGGGLSTRTINRIVTSYRKPGSKISPHSFRHGLGMRAVKAGIHPRHIQKILGHKHINSSQVYLDVMDADVVKAYKRIAKV